jgi:hypothetical protein
LACGDVPNFFDSSAWQVAQVSAPTKSDGFSTWLIVDFPSWDFTAPVACAEAVVLKPVISMEISAMECQFLML